MIFNLKSYAKVNLFLHIVGKRADNYHELESIFYFSDIYDEIYIDDSGEFAKKFALEGEFSNRLSAQDLSNNLIFKAYNLLSSNYSQIPKNLNFKLVKNLPVSAGIGGGSSNAATIINFLNQQYKLGLNDDQLIEYAVKLGADVPASIFNQTCFVTSIGEKLRFLQDFPRLNILLVNPLIGVSTQHIFQKGFTSFSPRINFPEQNFRNQNEIIEFLEKQDNDLYSNAVSSAPEISDVINIISAQQNCLISRMSGSGATCFGIFADKESLIKAKENISNSCDYWVSCDPV
jgi:4-diphosphocytidyl-2-C-methyl-D-erythritol kinase